MEATANSSSPTVSPPPSMRHPNRNGEMLRKGKNSHIPLSRHEMYPSIHSQAVGRDETTGQPSETIFGVEPLLPPYQCGKDTDGKGDEGADNDLDYWHHAAK
ncbi:hypothetical protein KHP11_26655 [Rhodococcus erythropolis]|uniref:hypothetical protein n=1 Tax=Rhodococcus erythropolis TaxID=1833 RepID=UPI0011131688|nr:hypothetical protein [Rhodococcus erythropolis]MBT1258052.1 hypothetical protein [Rhodococcus erythropolis]